MTGFGDVNEGPMQIENRSVRLVDMQRALHEVMPAAFMRESMFQVEISAAFRITLPDYITVVPTEQHAKDLLAAAVERLRIEAIHGLGLVPRLRAQDEQVERYREENRTLRATAEQRAARIVELEERLGE